jgi:hypothetical protein
MQRRRNAQPAPVSQAVQATRPAANDGGTIGLTPANDAQLPPPDAVMGQPVSQSTGHAAAPADLVVQLEVDGALVPVTVAELQRGYLREQDYRRKTQAAATELRRAQEQQVAFNQARQQLEARLPAFVAQFQQEFAAPIDWERLSREDPIGTSQKVARLLAFQQAMAEQQQLAQLRANEERGRKQQLLALGNDVLVRLIPGWADPNTRLAIKQAIRSHAISMGWSAEEVDRAELLDPRDVFLAWKSMNYDRLMAQRIIPQPVGAPTYAGNGAARRGPEAPSLTEAENRFAQTRRLDDALAIARLRREAQDNRPAAVTPQRLGTRY